MLLMRVIIAFLIAYGAAAQTRAVTDPGVVTTRQAITPAGVSMVFDGRVQSVAFGAGSSELWVSTTKNVARVDWRDNRVLEQFPIKRYLGLQGLVYDGRSKRALFATGDPLRLHSAGAGGLRTLSDRLGLHIAGMPALARKAGVVLVPMTAENRVVLCEAESGSILRSVNTEIAPYGVVVNDDATVAWVSNWGGRIPKAGERSARTGRAGAADRILIDSRGVGASGTVLRIDLKTGGVSHSVAVGLHPTAMAWDEAHARLYVANSNRDSISVSDTAGNRVVQTFDLQPFAQRVAGIAPSALAISPDNRTLYVACAGINAILVLSAQDGKIAGAIPTAWVPVSISVSADGQMLAAGCLLGAGSGWRDSREKRFVHSYRGSVQIIPIPGPPQLASYTTAVAENNRMPLIAQSRPVPRSDVRAAAIPARAGEPSLIEHVVYIIKENRTYDQVLGDLQRGNGDPSLVMYGEDVTPNHHRLAEQFVVLDNFYATGGNSADGHQWVTQANETLYCLWPGYEGRSYPFDGTDALAYSSSGFIWDLALQRQKSVRVFGEYVGAIRQPGINRLELIEAWKRGEDFSGRWEVSSEIPRLDQVLVRDFPSYALAIPDVVRAQIFLRELGRWEKSGVMPHLTIMLLPSDHTLGTSPERSSPRAMLADNDLALGRIVDGLTHSSFWKRMAIFVVEDDAQGGVDHVDGHRTVALAISPYTRRQYVDSTFYSQQSMLKTIELILGLPTLSLFDLIANDMRASFTDTPDETPYTSVEPAQSLFELNPRASALRGSQREGALASARMRWDVPDAVPSERLNRILWHDVRGWDKAYPGSSRAVFTPLAVEVDDGDR
jgi:sugar lactone lactonase YvrE